MAVQNCENCGTRFNYMDLQKSLWTGYKPINCKKCGAKHVWGNWYRIIFAVLIVLPVYPISKLASTMASAILTYIVYLGIISGLFPFVFKYHLDKNKE